MPTKQPAHQKQSIPSASQPIGQTFRNDILAGNLRVGASLRQDEIVKNHGVSKMPAQEALMYAALHRVASDDSKKPNLTNAARKKKDSFRTTLRARTKHLVGETWYSHMNTPKDQTMLLNYLYQNFLEENLFADIVGTHTANLNALIAARVFPSPSYAYASNGQSVSFVADFTDTQTYRFHLHGHTDWYRDITQLGLDTEARARAYFFNRYEQAKSTFLSSALGVELQAEAPDVSKQFNKDHGISTWGHFLNGVYGVCTRDGRPESVFLKQAGVMFIEQMIVGGPDTLSLSQTDLLRRAVGFLDGVESDFAPHEAPKTSRQRCILDVQARFLDKKAA